MSLITCLSHCVYQQDGYCSLSRAASAGDPTEAEPCVNFVPKALQNGAERLPDVVHPNEL